MKQKLIGVYEFGFEQVHLIAREGTGGEYYTNPEKGKIPRIKVGMDYKRWDQVVNVLIHETVEFAFDRQKARFVPTNELSGSHDQYLFVIGHPQFADACAKSAELITPALPDLARAWKLWDRKTKRRRSRKKK